MELNMNAADSEGILTELKAAQAEGMVWAAFNNRPDVAVNELRFFGTQAESEQFCEDFNLAFINPYEDDMGFDNWQYVPVRYLESYLLGIPESYIGLDMNVSDVAATMAAQNLHLIPGRSYDNLLDHFQNGQISPILWMQQIDPVRELSAYHIVSYQHEWPYQFDAGYNMGVTNSYENYSEAKAALELKAAQSAQVKDDVDHLLIGHFRGQRLELDDYGRPLAHSGIILDKACWEYEMGLAVRAWQIKESLRPDEPLLTQKYFFAAYDRYAQSVALLDGKLNKVTPESGEPIQYPSFYKDNLLITKNQKTMNQASFEFTRDQLKNLGFGDDIAAKLHTAMDQNLAQFQLEHSREFGKDTVTSVLHFSKGDQPDKDLTFFNRFDATLKQEGKEDLTQTFFIGAKYNYTLQERYNMMDGRSVYREQPKMIPTEGENGETKMKPTGETYNAWRSLDFKNADKYGNFNPKVIFWDHEKELQKYPIKNIEEKYDRSRMMRPLEKGNKVSVTLVRDGAETPALVVANPRMMRLDFYDPNGQSLILRKAEKQAVGQTQKVEMTPQEVQKAAIERAAAQKQEQQPKVDQSQTQQVVNGAQAQNEKAANTEQVAADQKNNQANRKRQGVHV